MPSSSQLKKPQKFDCRICKILDEDGFNEDLYEDHWNDNPLGCPFFAQMDPETKLEYARRAQLCFGCLDNDYVFKPYHAHVDCVGQNKNWVFSCNEETCCRMFIICLDHQDQNREMLESAAAWWRENGVEIVNSDSSSLPNIHTVSDSDDDEWDVGGDEGGGEGATRVEPNSSQA